MPCIYTKREANWELCDVIRIAFVRAHACALWRIVIVWRGISYNELGTALIK